MATEIERKFLVTGTKWRDYVESQSIYCQGYLSTDKHRTVRVRTDEEQGFLTIKGLNDGIRRSEFEYSIPLKDASEILDSLCQKPLITKKRYRVPYQDMVWEVDVFGGENQGLVLAEVELTNENMRVVLPDWIGEEVSSDPRYFNANLVQYPFSKWRKVT